MDRGDTCVKIITQNKSGLQTVENLQVVQKTLKRN